MLNFDTFSLLSVFSIYAERNLLKKISGYGSRWPKNIQIRRIRIRIRIRIRNTAATPVTLYYTSLVYSWSKSRFCWSTECTHTSPISCSRTWQRGGRGSVSFIFSSSQLSAVPRPPPPHHSESGVRDEVNIVWWENKPVVALLSSLRNANYVSFSTHTSACYFV